MRGFIRFLQLALISLLLPRGVIAQSAVPGEYLVKYSEKHLSRLADTTPTLRGKSLSSLKRHVRSALHAQRKKTFRRTNVDLVSISEQNASISATAQSLLAQGVIEYIEPNYIVSIYATPNDSRYSSLWGLHNTGQSGGTVDVDIDAPEAWNISTGDDDVVIGVLDTGVDYHHVDLAANMWVNSDEIAANGIDDDSNGVIDDIYGYNAVNDSGNPDDDNFHGTHVAGTIAGVGNNNSGVVGVSWNSKIMALKFLDSDGYGTMSDAVEAIEYAILMKERGVNLRIFNNSWGGSGYSSTLKSAFEEAQALGIISIAAAGNESSNNDVTPSYPASFTVSSLISVASINRYGNLSSFSNYGNTTVDLAAPGESILSTVPGNAYGYSSGTSMATPMVSGVAALLFSVRPWLTANEAKTLLLENTTSLGALSGAVATDGMLNASRTLASATTDNSEGPPEDDSDGDGVADDVETTDGTNPNDPGSYLTHLQSPVYVLWNSYLAMTNILELVNPSDSTRAVTVSLLSLSGDLLSQRSISVGASGQYDLILNDLPGFLENSYGLVKLEFSGVLEGRIFFYQSGSNGTYNFAYGVPFTNSLYGNSAVSFNTYQPSTNPQELDDTVANWLSIVNLASSYKSFTVNTYNAAGTRIAQRRVTVAPLGRTDIDGGHEIVGAYEVGLHKILPDNETAPYLAQLTRYGINSTAGSYQFAFPLLARAGNGERVHLPLSRQFGEDNWVEVVNTKNASVPVTISFRDKNGSQVFVQTVTLPPFAQRHFYATAYLPSGQIGSARITPDTSNSIIAQSMFYFRNSTGSMLSMYGSQARESIGTDLNGSYNLYLNMDNWLKISNTTNSSVTVTVTVNNPSDSGGSRTFTLGAFQSNNIALHSDQTLNALVDSYGFVEVSASRSNSIMSELLRRKTASGLTDFAAPTAVR